MSSRTAFSPFSAATMSGPWALFGLPRERLPARERPADDGHRENRPSFLIHKAGSYLGELDIYNTSESRNEFDSESLRFGVDWTMSDRWDMRVSLQSGETEKLTGVFDGLRIDRLALAIDAVEIYSDRRDLTGDTGTGAPDGRPDLVAPAARGTGTIVCNVQRYNPTAAQLAAVAAIQGRTKTTVNGTVPLASPIGLDNSISDCVPFNMMGNGQITPAASDYILTPKWGIGVVEQDFAEVLFRGELTDGWGAGPLSLATGLTYRDQSFNDGAYPVEIDALGPPFNAPTLGIRGIATTWSGGSPNLHQFSTVSAIEGGYDVWEAFGELNVPIWQSSSGERNVGTSFAYRSSDYSNVGQFDAWKIGLDFQLHRDLRLRATTVARRARGDVHRAVRQLARRRHGARHGAKRPVVDDHADDGRQSRPAARGRRHDGRRLRLSAGLGREPAHVGRRLRGRHLGFDRDARRAGGRAPVRRLRRALRVRVSRRRGRAVARAEPLS